MRLFIKWSLIVIGFYALAAAISFMLGPEDSCLDGGGCWDSIDKVCRDSEFNAQELCDRSKSVAPSNGASRLLNLDGSSPPLTSEP
jgi:hypothetical protein